ncbi:ABC transporter ATP-binding protein [Clostridium carnis]
MIKFDNINIKYGNRSIYNNFSISFKEKEITFIMGKTGVGKTTLLKEIKNRLLENGEKVSVIFQESRLIPWKSLYKNLEIVLIKEYSKEECNTKINKILKDLELLDYKNLYPYQLSGGMRQRANIARGLLYAGNIFLMDEPFKALDKESKDYVIKLTYNFIKENKKTAIIITHDESEVEVMKGNLKVLINEPVSIKES